jgi:hypothetical protein
MKRVLIGLQGNSSRSPSSSLLVWVPGEYARQSPSLLVSQLLRGAARLRLFAPALHLHQHKSIHNLHLQTRPRVSPHRIVNHSSHQGVTIHQSAPVLNSLSWSPGYPGSPPNLEDFDVGKCRFFVWLVLHGRCWTSDKLHRHGLKDSDT